jgi:hypothetical protein
MIRSSNVVLVKDGLILSSVRELIMRSHSENLALYAETTNTSGAQSFHIVDSIESKEGKLFIHLKELDPEKSTSSSEKVTDIRDFLKK